MPTYSSVVVGISEPIQLSAAVELSEAYAAPETAREVVMPVAGHFDFESAYCWFGPSVVDLSAHSQFITFASSVIICVLTHLCLVENLNF